jgi:TatD DNase family protein
MIIDTHAHLNFKAFDRDYKQVIQRAFAAGVVSIINVGSDLKTSPKAISIAEEYKKGVYAAVSIHPIHVGEIRDLRVEIEKLRKLAYNSKVVAIGETGLDYFKLKIKNEKLKIEKQKELFKAQLKLAKELNLPVIIHSRDAYEDTLGILTEEGKGLKGVIHCFLGNLQQAEQFLNLGFYISFIGMITFPKKEEVHEAIYGIPLHKIMVETDCPFAAPLPYRGQRNEPAYVVEVAKKIAEIKGVSFEEIAKATTENAKKLFKI